MDIRVSIPLLILLLSPVTALAVPVANNDTRTVPQNVPITIDVLNNDFDDAGDSLYVVADSVVQPEVGGTVVVNSDGGITFTPATDYIGQTQFNYTVENATLGERATATVLINVVEVVVSDLPLTANQVSVGQAIDAICGELSNSTPSDASTGTQDLADRCVELNALRATDEEAARLAVQQISPDETLSLSKVGSNASQVQTQMVSSRMMQLGSGISTAAQGGLTWSGGRQGGAAGDGDLFSKIGFFGSLQLEDANKDTSQDETGFDYQANSLALGADYAISQNWFMGGAFGLTVNDLDYKHNGGKVEADIYTFIAFSTYHLGNFNFDAQLGGGNSNIDIYRYMNYATSSSNYFDASTAGQTSGNQWFLSLQTQYMWSNNAITLYPAAKISYSGSRVKGYADNDAGGWEVVLDDQKAQKFTLETGIQATYAITTSWGVLVPNAELNIFANIDSSQDTVSGYFAYAPSNSLGFAMNAEEPDSVYYQLGLGSSVLFPGGNTGFIGIRQTLGYEDFSAFQFQAGMRMEF